VGLRNSSHSRCCAAGRSSVSSWRAIACNKHNPGERLRSLKPKPITHTQTSATHCACQGLCSTSSEVFTVPTSVCHDAAKLGTAAHTAAAMRPLNPPVPISTHPNSCLCYVSARARVCQQCKTLQSCQRPAAGRHSIKQQRGDRLV
jgi:hypothetical protein